MTEREREREINKERDIKKKRKREREITWMKEILFYDLSFGAIFCGSGGQFIDDFSFF